MALWVVVSYFSRKINPGALNSTLAEFPKNAIMPLGKGSLSGA